MTDDSVQVSKSALRTTDRPRKQSRYLAILIHLLCFAWILAVAAKAPAQELNNDTLRLTLNVTPQGIPVIQEAAWQATGRTVFRDLGTPDGFHPWVPESFIPPGQDTTPTWIITEGQDSSTAEATCELSKNMFITWIVELPKHGQLFRLRIRLTNGGKRTQAIEAFPAWSANWDVSGQSQWARWWQSISYRRMERELTAANKISLGSHLYSSDDADDGVNPYWVVGGADSRIYFGLQWCGGWNAKLQGLENGFAFSAGLPAPETQLVLGRRESIEGPALLVTPVLGSDDAADRRTWMRLRHSLGQALYSGPPPSIPLTYNHWYAAHAKHLDASFLNRQFAAMSSYSFDAFVVDAGWFADEKWKPDPAKFQPGEFEDMLASLKANGVKPGLWSTPQYVSETNNQSTLTIEDPLVTSTKFGGYLVDLSQGDFVDYLEGHVQTLRTRYSVDYWKYDQPFFSEQSRAGVMRNVMGFQTAMQGVRSANPDLIIENCLNGGRMINEFTLLATQISWLADLGSGGIPDPPGNISVALNAMDFIFPWAALRFTINLENIDQNDDEQLRLNCRSAMAGVWGVSTDLSKIAERQQSIILKEVENYRQLNLLKTNCEYDLLLPDDSADVAGVTFYSRRHFNAGVLLYRWRRDGAFDQRVMLPKLRSSTTYRVVDVDTGTEFIASGGDLISNGVTVPFSAQRLSALLFVSPVIQSPPPSGP